MGVAVVHLDDVLYFCTLRKMACRKVVDSAGETRFSGGLQNNCATLQISCGPWHGGRRFKSNTH